MEIDALVRTAALSGPAEKKASREAKDASFDALLNEAVQKAATALPPEKAIPTEDTEKMKDLSYNIAFRNAVCDRISKFLDTLETYQRQLEDPFTGLRQIAPTVERMEREQEELADALRGLPDRDELRDIFNEVVIRSALEVAAFKRGDYL